MNIISKIITLVVNILTIIFVLFACIFIALKQGFYIDKISTKDATITQLYIKLENKIILHAQNVTILDEKVQNEAKTTDSKAAIADIVSNFYLLDKNFEEIFIRNLSVFNNEIVVLFRENIFYVDSDLLTINMMIEEKDGLVNAEILELSLKDFDLGASGKARLDLFSEEYSFDGVINSYEISGEVSLRYAQNELYYSLKNAHANSIDEFMDEIGVLAEMDDDTKEWIVGKTLAKEYFIEDLSGKITFSPFDYHENEIKGAAFASDVSVNFDENLEPILANEAYIELSNGDLYIEPRFATYKNKSILNSSIYLRNIFETGVKADIKFYTNSLFDSEILEILQNYDINVPVIQHSGKMDAVLNLIIKTSNGDTKANGVFKISDADLSIAGADFRSKNATIELVGNKVFLKDTNLKMEFFDANLDGEIDLTTYTGKFDTNFNSLNLNPGNLNLLVTKNLKTQITLDFSSKDTILDLKNLGVKLNFAKNLNTIEIPKITNLKPYSPFLKEYEVDGGNLLLKTKDFENFDISIRDAKLKTPFLKKDSTSYESDDLYINVAKNQTTINTASGVLSVKIPTKGSMEATINDIDFAIDILGESESGGYPNLSFKGTNSSLIFKDVNRKFDFSNYSGKMGGKTLNFTANIQDSTVSLNIAPNIFKFEANDVPDSVMNSVIAHNAFKGGLFDISISGTDTSHFVAKAYIKDAFLADLVSYHNLLSFINSIPSLLVFKTPDFNDSGFSIKNGVVMAQRDGNLISVNAIRLTGTSADLGGFGKANLATKMVDFELELKYLKDATTIIDKIPIVNQIILGRDRKISTIIEVSGTYDKPKFKTNVGSDLASTPFSIIKNIIELPVSFFD
ncbi:MAG: AsmA-like C-terminal domain-containing protein [Campylobacter sp.]|nr:AsmA-like C-terminal domain-containing protein [Campylobacter sp.]